MEEKIYGFVMDTTNAHDADLVKKINFIFNDEHCEESRRMILFALAQRDKDEVKAKLDITINSARDIDKYERELLMNVCDDNDLGIIINFCCGDMDTRRNEKREQLTNLVNEHRIMKFDGDSFRFCGYHNNGFCNDMVLTGLSIGADGYLKIHSTTFGEDNYTDSIDFIPDFELDRFIALVKTYEPMKKWCIKVTASKVFEVKAKDYDSALEKAQEEYGKDPLTSQDIDSWVKVW